MKILIAENDKRILIVDDENDINLTFKIVLEDSGFKVDSFTNAFTALQNFKTGLYGLAILDVKMPGMNGFGLYQEIRKVDDKVKICFSTATSDLIMKILENKHFLILMKIALFGSQLKMNC